MSRHKILIGVILPMPARSYLYCMFRFWMMFAHALLWVKHAHMGGGTFPKCMTRYDHCLVLGPLFWEWSPPSGLTLHEV
jgi:hypothetical protein